MQEVVDIHREVSKIFEKNSSQLTFAEQEPNAIRVCVCATREDVHFAAS